MNENIIKKIMEHYITWLIALVGVVWSFFNFVALPIQEMKITMIQIKMDLAENKQDYKNAMVEHIDLQNRTSILETKVNQLFE